MRDCAWRATARAVERFLVCAGLPGFALACSAGPSRVDPRPLEIALRPIPHQMLFDRDEIVVATGEPLRLTLLNTDVMPHNLVVSRPGSLAAVGQASEALEAAGATRAELVQELRGTADVLWASPIVDPGGSTTLEITAPDTPGTYPFACTYRGHWIAMNGGLRVVDRPNDEDRAVNARPPRSTVEPPVRDFVREWTIDELASHVASLDQGRVPSPSVWVRGRGLYRDLGCERCHDRFGSGEDLLGPGFGDLWRRHSVVEALEHVVDPSAFVADRYRTTLVETTDGRFYSGILVEESDGVVRMRADPLDPEAILELLRADIESLERTPLSPMPSGLLATATVEDVRALMAYLFFEQ